MNRILLVAEIAACVQLGWLHAVDVFDLDTDELYWEWPLFVIACIAAIKVANTVIRKAWDIVLVIVYGTTDEEEIIRAHNARLKRRGRYFPEWEAGKTPKSLEKKEQMKLLRGA